MTKYASVTDGVIDTISIDRPQRLVSKEIEKTVEVWIPHEPTDEDPSEGHIDEKTVVETVDVFEDAPGWHEVPDDVFAGWAWDGTTATPPPPLPEPVPTKISRRQFYEQLSDIGKISQGEAFDAIATGVIPPALNAILNGMTDEDAKFRAAMRLVGATEFNRDDPLVMIFAMSQGMTETDVDNFWRAAATR